MLSCEGLWEPSYIVVAGICFGGFNESGAFI